MSIHGIQSTAPAYWTNAVAQANLVIAQLRRRGYTIVAVTPCADRNMMTYTIAYSRPENG